jgi:AraC-like DNA-binding protein
MIHSHETISLFDVPLFTKVRVKTPIKDAIPLPSEACYAYIVDGDGQSLSEEENIVAEPGRVILSLCGLTVGRMMAEQAQGRMDSIIVHFNQELLQQVFEGEKPALWKELEKPITRYVVQSAAGELVRHYFNGIAQLFQNQAALTESILKLKVKEIVLLLLQTDNAPDVLRIIRSLFSERTFSFKEKVDAHILTGASIENLAMITNCSLSTFKRKFKKVYQTSPAAYIMSKKIEQVAHLLKISEEPISAIGYDCGFESPEHLSRVFKKHYGMSPSAFRMTHFIK